MTKPAYHFGYLTILKFTPKIYLVFHAVYKGSFNAFIIKSNHISINSIYDFIKANPEELENNPSDFEFKSEKDLFQDSYFFWDDFGSNIKSALEMDEFGNNKLISIFQRYFSLEEKYFFYIEEDVITYINTNVDKKQNTTIGAFCRGCGDFNLYGEPDNIVNDNKYTCWNCAGSFERIRAGLSDIISVRTQQVQQIKTLNKII